MLSYSQTTTINGIKVSCFCAGHVLGAALFMIEVDGVRVLYTGDFSSEKDRHLQPADVPPGMNGFMILHFCVSVIIFVRKEKLIISFVSNYLCKRVKLFIY